MLVLFRKQTRKTNMSSYASKQNYNWPRTRPINRQPQAGFIARTPGGNIVSERKYYDSFKAATALTNVWSTSRHDPAAPIDGLFCPGEGSGINQRVGTKTLLHNIKIKGSIFLNGATDQTSGNPATTTGMYVRILLVQDMQTNGGTEQEML